MNCQLSRIVSKKHGTTTSAFASKYQTIFQQPVVSIRLELGTWSFSLRNFFQATIANFEVKISNTEHLVLGQVQIPTTKQNIFSLGGQQFLFKILSLRTRPVPVSKHHTLNVWVLKVIYVIIKCSCTSTFIINFLYTLIPTGLSQSPNG